MPIKNLTLEKAAIDQVIQKARDAGVSLTAYLITDMIKFVPPAISYGKK